MTTKESKWNPPAVSSKKGIVREVRVLFFAFGLFTEVAHINDGVLPEAYMVIYAELRAVVDKYYWRMRLTRTKTMSECIHFLLTAQLLFIEASEHHEANRVISERMELDRAVWYMKSYRKCLKDNK